MECDERGCEVKTKQTSKTPSTEQTTASESKEDIIPPPQDFKVERTAVAADRVGIRLSWSPPDTDQVITSYEIGYVISHLFLFFVTSHLFG